MPIIGNVVRDALYLADAAGTPITGATGSLTSTATLLGSVTTAAVTVTERSGGSYDVAFTPSAVGFWGLVVRYDNGVTSRVFTATYEVAAVDIPSAATVATAVVTALTARHVVTSPLAVDGTLTIVRGDASVLTITNRGWAIAPEAVIALTLSRLGVSTTYAGTRVSATEVSVSLSEAQTLALTGGRLLYRYALRDTIADLTLAVGDVTVLS